ncbi:hypothetical protein [Ideonella sp.]|uniref:hypothetical protein n=1 Tax=Ideonella sp. TaxID=1929293 RepID=UPI002B46CC1E|nr:hypothetical protein [Ideonella sp.]HJV68627.1 hypothetical protein [Ideonella sp.]
MKTRLACLLATPLLALAAHAAHAADPVYITLDHSSDGVIDKASAQAVWNELLAGKVVKLNKLYPTKRWGFVSEVEGGFNQGKTCVVTARAMMMPVTVGKSLVFKPNRTATAFDALPNATREQCQDLAKAKLKEAASGVLSGLMQ